MSITGRILNDDFKLDSEFEYKLRDFFCDMMKEKGVGRFKYRKVEVYIGEGDNTYIIVIPEYREEIITDKSCNSKREIIKYIKYLIDSWIEDRYEFDTGIWNSTEM